MSKNIFALADYFLAMADYILVMENSIFALSFNILIMVNIIHPNDL